MGGLVVSGGESNWLDDEFPEWLAAYDESLETGSMPPPLEIAGAPEELQPRLQRELAWCRFVRQVWPRDSPLSSLLPLGSTLSPPEKPVPGHVVSQLGRYSVRRELGRGAFGIVFLGYDPQLRREVALKVPRPEVLFTYELRERFRNEAQTAASLDHPNIVPVYDAGDDGATCYIASAYCPGVTLEAWFKRRGQPLPPRVAAQLVALLALAVDHAHRRGVLHRDLKPSNVLLVADAGVLPTESQTKVEVLGVIPRITDFGLAKFWGSAIRSGSPIYASAILGTPNYMAPEQGGGESTQIGPATDVYALGAILYELLTGQPPFQADSPLETLWRTRADDVVPPARLRPGLPRDLETICLKCLEKEPGRRYPTAASLNEDLNRFLSRGAIQARRPGVRAWIKSWARRRPRTALAILLGLVILATIAGCLLVLAWCGR